MSYKFSNGDRHKFLNGDEKGWEPLVYQFASHIGKFCFGSGCKFQIIRAVFLFFQNF